MEEKQDQVPALTQTTSESGAPSVHCLQDIGWLSISFILHAWANSPAPLQIIFVSLWLWIWKCMKCYGILWDRKNIFLTALFRLICGHAFVFLFGGNGIAQIEWCLLLFILYHTNTIQKFVSCKGTTIFITNSPDSLVPGFRFPTHPE